MHTHTCAYTHTHTHTHIYTYAHTHYHHSLHQFWRLLEGNGQQKKRKEMKSEWFKLSVSISSLEPKSNSLMEEALASERERKARAVKIRSTRSVVELGRESYFIAFNSSLSLSHTQTHTHSLSLSHTCMDTYTHSQTHIGTQDLEVHLW